MKLTFKKLLFATIVVLLLDISWILSEMWIDKTHGPVTWISPATVKFWAKDIGLLLLWVYYFVKEKKEKD